MYCYCIKYEDEDRNITPTIALSLILNYLKCKLLHPRFQTAIFSADLKIQRGMFADDQWPFLMEAFGLASLEVDKVHLF